ncbi:hypothetical protein GCM10007870_21250 [Gluconobacter kondonii]|uniref:Uncharacterized protein n=1 Tax=Gluconobacter kondonii TaxID=941463 RepID=A0ABQ5WV81_9PROT|nr:hypothetical protein AA3266_0626 [Gluconobacter kondonii NBRC 3266]GLQ66541.1 hypothetical protein GCM10007870_21250 [Gluconobacter kondonii]
MFHVLNRACNGVRRDGEGTLQVLRQKGRRRRGGAEPEKLSTAGGTWHQGVIRKEVSDQKKCLRRVKNTMRGAPA